MVDGQEYKGTSGGTYQGLDLNQPLYLGGVSDYRMIAREAAFNQGFVGK